MNTSDFSIVVTSHNQSQFIREAVDSALGQRLAAKEVIVVDDASKDGSPALLEQYGDKIILLKLAENRGACAARNAGAAIASGAYLVFLDGDDVMLPWAVEVYTRLLLSSQPKVILGSLFFFSGTASEHIPPNPRAIEFCEYNRLIEKDRSYRASASSLIVCRAAFHEVGGWTEQIFPMEDLDLIVKLSDAGHTVQILSPPTTCYRMHAGNTVRQFRACMDMLRRLIRRETRREYPTRSEPQSWRYAFIGGPAWFWVKKGFKAGAYADTLALAWTSWPMILAGGIRNLQIRMHGKRPTQSIELSSEAPGA